MSLSNQPNGAGDFRVLIVANGRLESRQQLEWAMSKTQLWIAVDGGIRHFIHIGKKPHRWIGDMDSFDAHLLPQMWSQEIQKDTFAPEKDLSDTELAIESAIQLGATSFVLMGMLGGRIDHALFNTSLLLSLQNRQLEALILAGSECLLGIGGGGVTHRTFSDLQGATMSLYPTTDLAGIDLCGFKYPLQNATMKPGETLGLSNEVIRETIEVTVRNGLALIAFSNCNPAHLLK